MISKRKGAAATFWKEHSEAWMASELTQAEYCTQHGINYRSFINQHSRLTVKSKYKHVNFVEAKSEKVSTNSQASGLQLMLPNGVRVGITNEVNAEFLKTVLTIAGALAC